MPEHLKSVTDSRKICCLNGVFCFLISMPRKKKIMNENDIAMYKNSECLNIRNQRLI